MRVGMVHSGVPFDLAFGADETFVMAWLVAHGENEGGEFDWNTLQWVKRDG